MSRGFYRQYLLITLTVLLGFNYLDRVALGVIQEDIKGTLALTDTQLGLMSGLAFTLLYAAMGIPIARWSDRGNRVHIIALTSGLWGIAVALCGVAGSFIQLLLVRVGVGIGEAGCVPPAHSLIADYFGRSERPKAVSLFLQGGSIAQIIGYLLVGWVDQSLGWRATFTVIGVPGLALALLSWLTLREPRARNSCASGQSVAMPMKGVLATLWKNLTFRHVLMCFSVWYFFGYGILQWQPTFFMRSHGLSPAQVGAWFALLYGVGSGIGLYLGGELVSRYAAKRERLQLNAAAASFVIFALATAGAQLVKGLYPALFLLAIASVGGSMAQGPIFATLQSVVDSRMRAMSIALVYLFANLIGMGLGPIAVGSLSDLLHGIAGSESLRYALALICPGYLWAAWHLWRAGRTVQQDICQVETQPPERLIDGQVPCQI